MNKILLSLLCTWHASSIHRIHKRQSLVDIGRTGSVEQLKTEISRLQGILNNKLSKKTTRDSQLMPKEELDAIPYSACAAASLLQYYPRTKCTESVVEATPLTGLVST